MYRLRWDTMNKETKGYLIATLLAAVVAIVFSSIYGALNEAKTSSTAPGPNADWNGRTSVVLKKKIADQWQWSYVGDNNKFLHARDTWAHDSLFFADGDLAGYLDNKILTGLQMSYLKNWNGDLMYEIRAGSPWEALINQNKIWVSWLVLNPDGDVVGYVKTDVGGEGWFSNEFEVRDVQDNVMFSGKRPLVTGKEWEWTLTQNDGNTFPLMLAEAMAAKISYDGKENPISTQLYQASFWLMVLAWPICGIFLGLTLYYELKFRCFGNRNSSIREGIIV